MLKQFLPEYRQHGARTALYRLWHRQRAVLAYILLALVTAYSLYGIQAGNTQRRHDLVNSTRAAIRVSCEAENQLRVILSSFLKTSRNQTEALSVRDHIITPAVAKQFVATLKKEEAQIAPTNCAKVTGLVSTTKAK